MLKIVAFLVASLSAVSFLSSCTGSRYAQTSIGQAFYSEENIPFQGGEVHCGDGRVCAEVEVVRVDIEKRNGGKVEVTLHNRTGSQVAVQIMVEIKAADGARLDSSNWQNMALQPRQEAVWSMPGLYKEGAAVRVSLRAL